jgi:hypothetical protein
MQTTQTIIFFRGQFYDTTSHKRVIPKEGACFILQGNQSGFAEKDPLEPIVKIHEEDEKLRQVLSIKDLESYALLLKKDSLLWFKVGSSRPNILDFNQCVFEIRLLEDLYIYNKKKGKRGQAMTLDCACIVEQCLTNEIKPFFEPLAATSLNNAFERVCMQFFSNRRSATTNVFEEFYVAGSMKKDYKLGSIRQMVSFTNPNDSQQLAL